MGKPWFGIDNYLWRADTQFSASCSHNEYPVSNLGLKHLWPGWRSDRKPLKFDGANDYLYKAHHADFNITDNLLLYCTFMVTDLSVFRPLINKNTGNDGYWFFVNTSGQLVLLLENGGSVASSLTAANTITTNTVYRAIAYKSGTTVRMWINGAEVVVTGVALATIGTNTSNLVIGNYGNKFQGYIWEAGVANVAVSEWHYPNLATTVTRGYWFLDNWSGSTILDSSTTSHNLTAVSLSSADNAALKGVQFVGIDFGSNQTVDLVVLDRRHNLANGATVLIGRSDYQDPITPPQFQSVMATAGEPVVKSANWTENRFFWIELNDDSTSEGYYDVPLVFLGRKEWLNRSFQQNYELKQLTPGTTDSTASRATYRHLSASELLRYELTFRCSAADREILRKVISTSASGYPVVFCPDSEQPEETLFCHVNNPHEVSFKRIYGDLHEVNLTLTEVG